MFDNPTAYGCVLFGDDSPESRRAAFESDVRTSLSGWDRDLTDDQREKIVHATVEAKLAGVDIGISSYMACLFAQPT